MPLFWLVDFFRKLTAYYKINYKKGNERTINVSMIESNVLLLFQSIQTDDPIFLLILLLLKQIKFRKL